MSKPVTLSEQRDMEKAGVTDLGVVSPLAVEIWGLPLRPPPEHETCPAPIRVGLQGENNLVYWCPTCGMVLGPATT